MLHKLTSSACKNLSDAVKLLDVVKLLDAVKLRGAVNFSRAFIFAIAIVAASTMGIDSGIRGSVSGQETPAAKLATPDVEELQQIQELLKQLDSASYVEREKATERLIGFGSKAIKPIAVNFFESSSEAGWRINKILEGIGTSGSEDDFLRTAAIIQELFGTQNERSFLRLKNLQKQWKITRRDDAAKELSKSGFTVSNLNSFQPAPDEIDLILRREVLARGVIIGLPEANQLDPKEGASKSDARQWTDPRKDRQASIVRIEQILSSDTETNRELISRFLPSDGTTDTLSVCEVQFPEKWIATADSLKLLEMLSPIGSVMLKNQKIDDELLSMLSSEDLLTFMVFENCSFESLEDKPIELPKKLSQLSFRGAAPEASFFRSIKRPFMLSMQDLQLSEDVAKELYARSVQSIFFNNVAFDEKTIQRLLRARSLTQITFTLCQFKLDWFADVRRNRPELGINAAPVAFLGVQGPIDISNRNFGGCQISQVVADTGAAKGGLQVNDIIVEVENQRISAFADLRLMISQKKPGEKMKLKVLRGTERLDLTIELGEPNR